jgi:hypothetical protein
LVFVNLACGGHIGFFPVAQRAHKGMLQVSPISLPPRAKEQSFSARRPQPAEQ